MTPLSDSEAATVQRFENAEPAPESWGGELREALREALYGYDCEYLPQLASALDRVEPVVTAYAEQRARERAAEELRAAADSVPRFSPAIIAKWLRDRADALAADDRTGQR